MIYTEFLNFKTSLDILLFIFQYFDVDKLNFMMNNWTMNTKNNCNYYNKYPGLNIAFIIFRFQQISTSRETSKNRVDLSMKSGSVPRLIDYDYLIYLFCI